MLEYLIGSVIFLIIWLLIFIFRKDIRKKIMFMSLLAAPLGLSEFLFVPYYWTPDVVFPIIINGLFFDIESIIFCFAIGGIASAIYDAFTSKYNMKPYAGKKHPFGISIFILIFFAFFSVFFRERVIYSAVLTMICCSAIIVWRRKDLSKRILFGTIYFSILYFFVFILLDKVIYLSGISLLWNSFALSNIYLFGVPLEEILFAISFSALWSGLYEYKKNLK